MVYDGLSLESRNISFGIADNSNIITTIRVKEFEKMFRKNMTYCFQALGQPG